MDLPALPADAPRHLLIGFSGGRDSCALLHRLAMLREERGWRLRAVHVDHGLHPDSAHWAEQALSMAAVLGVDCALHRVAVRPAGSGLEAAARRARMDALAAERRQDETLVLAQHRDDQIETVLLALLRGRDRGLAGMRGWTLDARGPVWRPLLDISAARIADYARQQALRWIDDPSNTDPRIERNALRHALLPTLRQHFPAADNAIAALAARQATTLAAWDALAERDLADLLDAAGSTLDADGLRALGPARGAAVLRHWVGAQHGRISNDALSRVFGTWAGMPRSRALRQAQGVFWLRQWDGRLWWTPRPASPPAPPATQPPPWDGRAALDLGPGGVLRLSGAEALPAALHPRRRADGDGRWALQGASSAGQRVSARFTHWRIPPWQRDTLPLLVDAEGRLQAIADLDYAPAFDHWLRERGARLLWQPGPGLG